MKLVPLEKLAKLLLGINQPVGIPRTACANVHSILWQSARGPLRLEQCHTQAESFFAPFDNPLTNSALPEVRIKLPKALPVGELRCTSSRESSEVFQESILPTESRSISKSPESCVIQARVATLPASGSHDGESASRSCPSSAVRLGAEGF